MCPACWDLRGRSVAPQTVSSGTGLQTAALVLGCIALLPVPVLQIISVVVNVVALVKAKHPPARNVRWRPITGLALTGVGLVITALVFSGAVFDS